MNKLNQKLLGVLAFLIVALIVWPKPERVPQIREQVSTAQRVPPMPITKITKNKKVTPVRQIASVGGRHVRPVRRNVASVVKKSNIKTPRLRAKHADRNRRGQTMTVTRR